MDQVDPEFRIVSVVYHAPGAGLDFALDEKLRISSMEATARLGDLFCVNDQILFVDGFSPSSIDEALDLMGRTENEIVVDVLRSELVEPVSKARAQAIDLRRRTGYSYFVARLRALENHTKIGLSMRLAGSNVFVAKVERDGIANGVVLPGDILLDVNGVRTTGMSVPEVKKTMAQRLGTTGLCSVVVERAENYDTRAMHMNALHLQPMPKKLDPEMPSDAAAIGTLQCELLRARLQTNGEAEATACPPPPRPVLRKPSLERKKSRPRRRAAADAGTTEEAPAAADETIEAANDDTVERSQRAGCTRTEELPVVEEGDANRHVRFSDSDAVVDIGMDAHQKPLKKVPSHRRKETCPRSGGSNSSSRSVATGTSVQVTPKERIRPSLAPGRSGSRSRGSIGRREKKKRRKSRARKRSRTKNKTNTTEHSSGGQ